MLITLLRVHPRTYWGTISAIGALQLVQTLTTLYLPNLNADIIGNGVAVGDTGHILRVGGFMLIITLLQIAAAISPVYMAAKTAMSLGREVRAAVVARVHKLSAREVDPFHERSLLPPITHDV